MTDAYTDNREKPSIQVACNICGIFYHDIHQTCVECRQPTCLNVGCSFRLQYPYVVCYDCLEKHDPDDYNIVAKNGVDWVEFNED